MGEGSEVTITGENTVVDITLAQGTAISAEGSSVTIDHVDITLGGDYAITAENVTISGDATLYGTTSADAILLDGVLRLLRRPWQCVQ